MKRLKTLRGYFLVIVCATCCLFGQNQLPNRDGIHPGEGGDPFAGLDDVAGFIAAKRKAINAKVAKIHGEFTQNKSVPEGISAEEGRSGILITGRVHPELFDHTAVLVLFVDRYNSSLKDICVGGLIARGFRPKDLAILADTIGQPDYPHGVFQRYAKTIDSELPRPNQKRASDEEIRQYLEDWRHMMSGSLDTWATEVLQKLPLRARRILLAYAYEAIVPQSHVTQWFPIGGPDIQNFRNPEGAP